MGGVSVAIAVIDKGFAGRFGQASNSAVDELQTDFAIAATVD
jgi:hypothetical protein